MNLNVLMRDKRYTIELSAIIGVEIFDVTMSIAPGKARVPSRDGLRLVHRQQVNRREYTARGVAAPDDHISGG